MAAGPQPVNRLCRKLPGGPRRPGAWPGRWSLRRPRAPRPVWGI